MFPNLTAELARYQITQLALSNRLGLSPKTLTHKLSGKTQVSLAEMRAIQKAIPSVSSLSLDYLFSSIPTNETDAS